MRAGQSGFSAVEAVVALLLGLSLVHVAVRALVVTRSAQAEWTERSERLATLRIARTTLRGELARGAQGRDWRIAAPDSVTVRSFLGRALPCGKADATGTIPVSYEGRRRADPSRDSLLALGRDGHWSAVPLHATGAAAGPCPGSGTPAAGAAAPVHWRTGLVPGNEPGLLLLFTRVSYHVAGGAIRLRAVRGGRQPLTPGVLTGPSGFAVRGGDVSLRLEAVDGWSWSGTLGWAGRRGH